jgi:hypothetical protein
VRCDECGGKLQPYAELVYLPDLGYFHPECLERCPCGIDWPKFLITAGDVRFTCAGCSRAGEAA